MSPKDTPKEELLILLNAYIDGELSSARMEKLERQLTENPELRILLSQLHRTREVVAELPRLRAPEGMAEDILRNMERDALLSLDKQKAVRDGRNHLFARRFAASAAMLLLCAAAVMVIYNILKSPARQVKPPVGYNKPVIALRSPAGQSVSGQPIEEQFVSGRSAPLQSVRRGAPRQPALAIRGDNPSVLSAPNDLTNPVNVTNENNRNNIANMTDISKGGAIAADAANISVPAGYSSVYSSLKIILTGNNVPFYGRKLRQLLADNNINHSICSNINNNKQQYAFICSLGKFKKLYPLLANIPAEHIGLVLPGKSGSQSIFIPEPSEKQVMTLACLADTSQRRVLAMKFAHQQLEAIPGNSLSDKQLGDQMELYACQEPQLTDLKLLGKTGNSPNSLAVAQLPEKYIHRLEQVKHIKPVFSANNTRMVEHAGKSAVSNRGRKVSMVALIVVLQSKPNPNTNSQGNSDNATGHSTGNSAGESVGNTTGSGRGDVRGNTADSTSGGDSGSNDASARKGLHTGLSGNNGDPNSVL